jgi:tetratricopeptide (TPR) repeat protein/transglutaminase-like putative cysteine protease
MIRRPFVVVFLFAMVNFAARAESPAWPVSVGPPRSSAPVRYEPGAWKDVPAEFLDDAAACFLYSGTTQRLETDGTTESTTHEIIRLNGRKGIDQLGEYRTITFAPAYERVTLHAARVHKKNGGVIEVGPRNVQVRDVNTDHQIYDPSKQLVISFPALEVGDTVEVHWTTRGRHPEHPGQLFSRYQFGNDKYPVVRDEWCVRVPEGRELKHATVNGNVALTVTSEGGERVYRWVAKHRRPLPQGDHLPSAEEYRLEAVCSTFTSWDEVGRWDQSLVADRSGGTPDVRAVVAEVTRALSTPLDKARVLAQWVRRNVRYVSSGEKHDYTPHPPGEVLAVRAGDCKDTAHLYVVMARAAGLKAAVATLCARDDGQIVEAVPSPWGSHAIAVVTIDGKDHWVDLTANLIGWDVLPRDDRDRLCYITDASGVRLARTPAPKPANNRSEHVTAVTVATDGSARVERRSTYQGVAAWVKRDEFVDTPKAERRRLVTAELLDAYPKARLSDLEFDASLAEVDRPLTVRASFQMPELFSGGTTREGTLGEQGPWTPILALNVDRERKTAIDLGEPFETVQRFTVKLPATHRFADVPGPQSIASAWGTFDFRVTNAEDRPRTLELEFRSRLTRTRVEPADFATFEKFQDGVQSAFRARLSLQATTQISDAKEIEQLLTNSPDDLGAATVLAELYLRNDKRGDAVRVLGEARRRHPGERPLWELSLAAVDSLEGHEDLLRAMVRQFPEDTDTALDLAGNLIAQAKHEDAAQVLQPLASSKTASVKREALLLLARSAQVQEEPRKALRHLRAAEQADAAGFQPSDWQLLGEVHEALAQPRQALRAYVKALDDDPDDEDYADLLLAAARLSAATGNQPDAAKYLNLFRAEASDDAAGLARAADVAVRLGRFDTAAELLEEARRGEGDAGNATERPAGLVAAHRGKFAEAVTHLERVDPDADVLVALIDSQIALGKLSDAERTAGRVRQVELPTSVLRESAAIVEALSRRRDEVRKSAMSEVDPTSTDRFVCAEHLHSRRRLPDRVAALLNECMAGNSPPGPAYGLRAVTQVEKGRLTKALADAERAITLSPKDAHGYYARGRIRLERTARGALADLERAAELSRRRDGIVLHHLAAAQHQAGMITNAIETQRAALALVPDDDDVQAQLREFEGK